VHLLDCREYFGDHALQLVGGLQECLIDVLPIERLRVSLA
jgi:hypothetical protein